MCGVPWPAPSLITINPLWSLFKVNSEPAWEFALLFPGMPCYVSNAFYIICVCVCVKSSVSMVELTFWVRVFTITGAGSQMSRWWLLSLGSFFSCSGLQYGNMHLSCCMGWWALWAVLPLFSPACTWAVLLCAMFTEFSITASVIDLADLYQKLQPLSSGDNDGTIRSPP